MKAPALTRESVCIFTIVVALSAALFCVACTPHGTVSDDGVSEWLGGRFEVVETDDTDYLDTRMRMLVRDTETGAEYLYMRTPHNAVVFERLSDGGGVKDAATSLADVRDGDEGFVVIRSRNGDISFLTADGVDGENAQLLTARHRDDGSVTFFDGDVKVPLPDGLMPLADCYVEFLEVSADGS